MGDGRRSSVGRRARRALVAATAVLACAAGALPAQAAVSATDFRDIAATWDEAAARLGTAGSLWEPMKTGALERVRRIDVLADNLAFANAAVTAGDTYVGARYRSRARTIEVDEKWANTGWAAEPVVSTSQAPVGSVRIRIGTPGLRTTVVARVFANCFTQPAAGGPKRVPAGFRCTRADVLRTGGTLTLTARPASTMTSPGDTSVVIRSKGLSFAQLVAVASSLQQVAGSPADGAGSAQMVAMCGQMVTDAMTPEQASAFAQSNGYWTRVGSIDGVPQAVTADFRPDRFTLAIASGTVASCTYG